MANTITNLIPDVYAALNVVSRELTGFIPAVTIDASASRIAANQTLRSAYAPAATAADVTPAMSLPSASDQTIANRTITMGTARKAALSINGEEELGLNSGPGYNSIKQNQIEEAVRTLVNEIEEDIAQAAYLTGTRAYGTAGTTPFASNLADSAQVRRILDESGSPGSQRSLVIDPAAGAALRTLTQLSKANENGSDALLRQGTLLDIHGFMVRESAYVQTPTAGSGASYLLNGAVAVGATTITVDTGSGTILAGDVVTIGGVKYIAKTALSGATFTIEAPGIRVATADNAAITVNAAAARNIAFPRSAIVLATRLPAVPSAGDQALMRETITDPRTGISMELAAYPGYRMVTYELSAIWGVSVFNPRHVAQLLG